MLRGHGRRRRPEARGSVEGNEVEAQGQEGEEKRAVEWEALGKVVGARSDENMQLRPCAEQVSRFGGRFQGRTGSGGAKRPERRRLDDEFINFDPPLEHSTAVYKARSFISAQAWSPSIQSVLANNLPAMAHPAVGSSVSMPITIAAATPTWLPNVQYPAHAQVW